MNAAQRREWREHVYGCPELSEAQRLVLLALSEFADWPDGTNAHPGTDRLAELCGLKTRAVEYALARGRALKLIQQTQRAKPKRGWASVYRLVPVPAITRTQVRVMDGYYPHESALLPAPRRAITRTPVHPTKPLALSPRQERARGEPPRRCPTHADNPNPPPCGPCGNARRANDAWKEEQAERLHADAEHRRRAITECPLCDDHGWRLGDDGRPADTATRCTHKDETDET